MIHIICSWGGMGDQIARAASIRAVLEDERELNIALYVFPSVVSLFQQFFGAHPRVHGIYTFDEFRSNVKPNDLFVDFGDTRHFQLGMHPIDHAYMTICSRMPRRKINYIPLSDAPAVTAKESSFVALTPNFTAENRALPAEWWNELIRQLRENGLTPLILGSTKSEFVTKAQDINTEGCFDLRDKTSLIDAAKWIQRSIAVVGLDNGLIHLAACTKTPIIVAYSSQYANNRVPVRQEGDIFIVTNSSKCVGCEVWLRFKQDHKYTTCIKETYECLKGIEVDTVMNILNTRIINKEAYDAMG